MDSTRQSIQVEGGQELRHDFALERGNELRGRVVDRRTGYPIVGARVGRPFGDPVLTDGHGDYVLPGFNPRYTYSLDVAAEGYASAAEIISPGQLGQPLNFALESGLSAQGRLVDERGEPLSGVSVAAVAAWEAGGTQLTDIVTATTSEKGRFTVAPLGREHRYALLIRQDGLATQLLDFPRSRSRLDDIDLGITTVPEAGLVRGWIERPDGEPVADQFLEVRAEPSGRDRLEPGVEPAFEEGFQGWNGRTDDLGRFSFGDLPEGKLTFSTRRGGHYHALGTIELARSEQRDAVVLTYDPGLSLTGRVVDPDGTPVDRVSLHLIDPETGNNVSYTVSRGEGRFEFGGLQSGVYDIVGDVNFITDRDDLTRTRWSEISTDAGEPELVIDQVEAITGTVLNEDRSIRHDAVVSVDLGEPYGHRTYPTDEHGQFEIPVAEGSRVDLTVGPAQPRSHGAAGMQWVHLPELSKTIENVEWGTSGLEITLPAVAKAHGRVLRGDTPVSKAVVYAQYPDGATSRTVATTTGEFALTLRPEIPFALVVLPAGEHLPSPTLEEARRIGVVLENQMPGPDAIRVTLP